MQIERWLKKKNSFLWLSSLLALALTFALYGRVISVPFYSDDLLQIPWARTAPMEEIWGTLNPFSHFRPVQFTVWRLWQIIAGDLNPRPLRLLNLLFHAGSAVLTGWLAFRFTEQDRFAGLGATALFALFPFSYDAILWVSSAAYPLAVFLGLLAIHCWISSGEQVQTGRWGSLFAAIVFAVAAALSLESGILVGILFIAVDLLLLKPAGFKWWRIGVALAASLLPFLAINFLTPTPASPFDLNRLIQNGGMMGQATTFPFSYLLTFFADGWNQPPLLIAIGLIFAGVVLFIGYRSPQLRGPLAFALLWIGLWGAIPAVTQTYTWLRDPPRAFYPCAVGIALAWGLPLAKIASPSAFNKNLYRIVLCGLMWVPVSFNIEIANDYAEAGNVLQQVLDSDQSVPNLYMNLPERFGPWQNRWPLGYQGIIPMPPPTDDVALLLAVNGRPATNAVNRVSGQILAPPAHDVGLAGQPFAAEDLTIAQSDLPLTVYSVDYASRDAQLVSLGQLRGRSPDNNVDYLFSEDGLALKINGCHRSADADHAVELSVTWSAVGSPLAQNRSMFVHLWQNGEIVAQADGQFLDGLLPIGQLSADTQLVETHRWVLQSSAEVSLGIGLYDPASGERAAVHTANGDLVPDGYITLDCDD